MQGREITSVENPARGEIKMTTTSANYAGLLPVEASDEPPPVRPTTFENDPFPKGQPSLRKRATRALFRFLITFCSGIGATLVLQSYGDVAREMIANSYPRLGWLASRPLLTAQNAPGTIGPAASAAVSFDQQQINAMSPDAIRQSLDRIAAGQEQIMSSIDQISIRITAGYEQMRRSTDQIATSIAAGQDLIARSIDQIATSIAHAPSAKASGIMVESRTDGASLQPTARLDIKPTEAGPAQTSSERVKQPSAVSRHDRSCFPTASAVLEHHKGAWPSWTLRAPGHEGTRCWYAVERPGGNDPRSRGASDHRSETTPGKEIIGTTENRLSAPPVPHAQRLE